jgi:phosphoribosylanthranilate isomerase
VTRVKICGLTNLEDARWAWLCGADLLGFIFVRSSPRYIEVEVASAMAAALRDEGCRCQLVGVFAGSAPEEVRRLVTTCDLDLVQLHRYTDRDVPADLGAPLILGVRVKDGPLSSAALAQGRPDVYACLLDTYDPERLGGTGQTWDWSRMCRSREPSPPIVVAGGLTPANVREAIRLTRPWGVDVSSGVEALPGRKDHDKVLRFIRNVREEDAEHG